MQETNIYNRYTTITNDSLLGVWRQHWNRVTKIALEVDKALLKYAKNAYNIAPLRLSVKTCGSTAFQFLFFLHFLQQNSHQRHNGIDLLWKDAKRERQGSKHLGEL